MDGYNEYVGGFRQGFQVQGVLAAYSGYERVDFCRVRGHASCGAH